jgi:SHS2 domain-containing protein
MEAGRAACKHGVAPELGDAYNHHMHGERGHCELEHPADLVLQFWAPSERELLVEAAQALIEVLTEAAEVAPERERDIELEALDSEDRLVRWLNEVLLLATVEGFVLCDADIELRPGGLAARVRGQAEAHDLVRTELKCVTYHGLELGPRGERFVGQVTIDV